MPRRPGVRSVTVSVLLLPMVAGCSETADPLPATLEVHGPLPASAGGDHPWPGWGGPGGDFRVADEGLAESWPEGGPPVVWERPLGGGYAAIVAGRGALFTMYRREANDVVAALRADTGETLWEYSYPAPTREKNATQFGSGPNATPLLLEDRIITLGYTGILSALRLDDGELLWSHDLIGDFGGEVLDFGYSASPVAHEGKVIVLVGGEQAVMAFAPEDGAVVWRSPAGSVSYATPSIIDVDGQTQIVYLSADEVLGLDAANGALLWRHPCVNEYRNNASGVLWGEDDLLWVATQLDGGARVLRLGRDASGATRVDPVWFSNRISIHFWNALRIGDHVYASIGSQASILAGIDVRSGEFVWRRRGFNQANFVQAGGLTVLLDETGQLALVRLRPEGLEILARTQVVDEQAWTVPTLVGTSLYVRDRKTIRALDLSAGG